jgi:hypothetical protein
VAFDTVSTLSSQVLQVRRGPTGGGRDEGCRLRKTPQSQRHGRVGCRCGAVVVLIRQRRRRVAVSPGEVAEPQSKWRAVIIDRSPDEVMPDNRVPGPVAELGALVQVEVRAAPGGKGSELRARLRRPERTGAASAAARLSGDDPRQQVRAALREAKQLIEVGEVLRVDPTPHGRRTPTPTGAVVELYRASGGGGSAVKALCWRWSQRDRGRDGRGPDDPQRQRCHPHGAAEQDVRVAPAPAGRLHPDHARRGRAGSRVHG